MAKNSVFGKPQYSGSAPRSGFSPDQDLTFTCSTGMLLPVYTKFLNPGDRISGVPKFFLRTDPLVRPAMADIDVFVDVFFVPMRHILGAFEQWYTQIDDRISDLVGISSDNLGTLPVVGIDGQAFKWMTKDIFNIQEYLPTQYSNVSAHPLYGPGCHRLTEMLGYNASSLFYNLDVSTDYSNILPEYHDEVMWRSSPAFCPYKFAAYQKIYYDYYRDTDFESNIIEAYNFDSFLNNGTPSFAPANVNDKRLNMFRLRYRNRSKDYFTNIHLTPLYNSIGMLPNAQLNLVKMNNWLQTTDAFEFDYIHNNQVYLRSGLSYPDPITLEGDTGSDVYRWTNSQGGQMDPLNAVGTGSDSLMDSVNGDIIKHNHDVELEIDDQALAQGNALMSLANIRGAFAYEKLLRITNNAGKHVDDQIFAHFGVKVPQGISNEVYKLKSYHTMIHFGEVTATAATSDADLAEMAGRGTALLNDNDKFSFSATVPGIVMAIMSCAPRYKYIGVVEKDGFKTTLPDFFKPVLDHLGQQPLFAYESSRVNYNIFGSFIYGWQYRFMEDKVKPNRVSLVFSTVSKNPWSMVSRVTVGPRGNFVSTWNKVTGHDLHNIFVSRYAQDFYAWPDGGDKPYDYTVVANSPATFLSSYLTDPFTVDFHMEANLVSQMSTFGEPSLNGI